MYFLARALMIMFKQLSPLAWLAASISSTSRRGETSTFVWLAHDHQAYGTWARTRVTLAIVLVPVFRSCLCMLDACGACGLAPQCMRSFRLLEQTFVLWFDCAVTMVYFRWVLVVVVVLELIQVVRDYHRTDEWQRYLGNATWGKCPSITAETHKHTDTDMHTNR